MATTSNALDALLFLRDGNLTARWNFPLAIHTPLADPTGLGLPVILSYSFLDALPPYASTDYPEPISGFQAFDLPMQQATANALVAIQEVIGVSFVQSVGAVGQITFGQSAQLPGQGGYAYSPGYQYSYSGTPETLVAITESTVAGDIWINTDSSWIASDWAAGGSGYATLLHEIGHALGLKHPFESTASGFTLDPAFDSESHTVMSYTSAPRSTLLQVTGTLSNYTYQIFQLAPSTLMPMDIEALQYLYGANTSTRTGNDIYQWANNPEILETVWDAGGTDTIDCTNQTLACLIDLTPGSYSSIGLRQTDAELRLGLDIPSWFTDPLPADIYNGSNNLAIAKGVVIEAAMGGSGNDVITGNGVSNTLSGGPGNDTLQGGAGFDTAVFSGPLSSYVLTGEVPAFTVTGGDGTDSLTSIERLRFSDGDVLVRTNSAPTFAIGSGTLTTDFGLPASAYAIAAQDNGRLLLAGACDGNFAVARYHPDGSLDTSFDGDGKVTSILGTGASLAAATCVTLQSDGKILTAGFSNNNFALVRYNTDGSLDASFDQDGVVTTDLGGADQARGMAIQPDGKIVLAGYGSGSIDFALTRYNTDGSFDTSFDGDGKVLTNFGSSDRGWSMALQADGKIVVAGISNNNFALARYNTNGSLDAGFGNLGTVTTDLGSVDSISSVAVQPDGRILAGGYSNNNFALARYNPDGTLDTRFNATGIVITDVNLADRAEAVALQPDGSIVLAGTSSGNFSVVRYTADGILDTSFSADGKVTTDFGLSDAAHAMLLLPDGAIVVAGNSGGGIGANFAMAKYLADGRPDLGFGVATTLNSTPVYNSVTAVVLDSSVSVYDAELSALDNYAGSQLTLARHTAASVFDEFSARAGGTLSTLTAGADLLLGSLSLGQVVNNTAGQLQITFNSNATADRISQVIQQIAYANTDADPLARVQIDWTLSDGNYGMQGLGGAKVATGNTLVNIANGLQALDVLAYNWKSHALLDSVQVADTIRSAATGLDGSATLRCAANAGLGLSVTKDIAPAQLDATAAAVDLQDAIAILKMIVGLEVNGAGKPMSPYQALAADFDGNGAVQLTDAIDVLRHVVGLSAPAPTWHFADESSGTVAAITSHALSPGLAPVISVDTSSAIAPLHVGLVGYLTGDVDGSCTSAPGAQNLDVLQPTYLTDLTAAHGLSLTQFGVYGV